MMPVVNQRPLGVRRGRRLNNHSRLADRRDGTVEPDQFDLRRRVIIEDSFVLGAFQQILEGWRGGRAAEILLDHRPGWNFTALKRRSSISRHRLAQEALAGAQPFAYLG